MSRSFTVDTNKTLSTSLVANYNLNYNGYDSVGQRPFTEINAGASFTSGKVKNALTLTGASNSYIRGNFVFGTQNYDWSVSLWVYLSGTSLNGIFVACGQYISAGGSDGWYLGVGNTNITNAGNNLIWGREGIGSNSLGTIGGSGWKHVGMIIEPVGTGADVYRIVNGSKIAAGLSAGTMNTPTTRTTLGANGQASTPLYRFTGQIDEVSFWNKELSAQEVTDLYNSGSGNPIRAVSPFAFPVMP